MGEHNDIPDSDILGYVGPENYGLPAFEPDPERGLTPSEVSRLFCIAADIAERIGLQADIPSSGDVETGSAETVMPAAAELYEDLAGTTHEDWDANPELYRSLARQVKLIAEEHIKNHKR